MASELGWFVVHRVELTLFFFMSGTVEIAKSPKISLLLTYMTPLRATSKCYLMQKVRNSSVLYHKTKNPFKVRKLRGSIILLLIILAMSSENQEYIKINNLV